MIERRDEDLVVVYNDRSQWTILQCVGVRVADIAACYFSLAGSSSFLRTTFFVSGASPNGFSGMRDDPSSFAPYRCLRSFFLSFGLRFAAGRATIPWQSLRSVPTKIYLSLSFSFVHSSFLSFFLSLTRHIPHLLFFLSFFLLRLDRRKRATIHRPLLAKSMTTIKHRTHCSYICIHECVYIYAYNYLFLKKIEQKMYYFLFFFPFSSFFFFFENISVKISYL